MWCVHLNYSQSQNPHEAGNIWKWLKKKAASKALWVKMLWLFCPFILFIITSYCVWMPPHLWFSSSHLHVFQFLMPDHWASNIRSGYKYHQPGRKGITALQRWHVGQINVHNVMWQNIQTQGKDHNWAVWLAVSTVKMSDHEESFFFFSELLNCFLNFTATATQCLIRLQARFSRVIYSVFGWGKMPAKREKCVFSNLAGLAWTKS